MTFCYDFSTLDSQELKETLAVACEKCEMV